MKLFGMQQSRSFRCLWALEEAGIEYEYIPVKLRTGFKLGNVRVSRRLEASRAMALIETSFEIP